MNRILSTSVNESPSVLAISNLMPPDFVGGYELGAAALLSYLRNEFGWKVTTYCGHRQKNIVPHHATPSLLGYFPLGWKNHLILPRILQQAKNQWPSRLQQIQREAPQQPVFLFNPRRLWIPEWGEWIAQAPAASTYISDLWPEAFPECDLFQEVLFHNRERLPWWVKRRQSKLQEIYRSTWPKTYTLSPLRAPIFVSEFIRKRTLSAFPEVVCEAVIPWGIEVDQFPVKTRTSEQLTTWGFMGRIHEEKGLHEALEVLEVLLKERKKIRLLIAGDDTTAYGKTIKEKVRKNPLLSQSVEFLGKVSRERIVSDFLHRIGVLLFPSLWEEPFAITVLEALSTGLPIIASNRGGTPEIIHEKTGYLYAPEKRGDFLNQARQLLSDPDEALSRGAYGAKVIRRQYTMKSMAERVDAFHREYWNFKSQTG